MEGNSQTDPMCDWCNGKGALPMLNVWLVSKEMRDGGQSPGVPIVEEAPCPSCHTEQANEFVAAMIEKHGQPFSDGQIVGYSQWRDPAGRNAFSVTNGKWEED